ncbi:MAG: hypothetical protein Q8P50_10000 [Bacillota bacterium]|nr:hypothetical protein [Bacillota bacterium]
MGSLVLTSEQPVHKRIRWKAGKEDELWDYVQSRMASGISISEALKTFADKNSISWLTARWKYYRLRQDRAVVIPELEEQDAARHDAARAVGPGLATDEAAKSDQTLQALSNFLSSASKLEGVDLTGLLTGLSNMATAALSGEEARHTAATIRTEYNELLRIMQEYDRRFAQVRQEYQTLAGLVDEWLNLHSVDRVTTMGEFGKKLRVQVDQFNRVLALAENVAGKR